MKGGVEFPGGSTAMGCDQLLENNGYMAIVADEACNFFPRKYATSGDAWECGMAPLPPPAFPPRIDHPRISPPHKEKRNAWPVHFSPQVS